MPSSRPKRKRPALAPRQIESRSELPPCAGPKLRAFDDGQTPIKWFQRLDINPPGSQACVFKVQIGLGFYALKIVLVLHLLHHPVWPTKWLHMVIWLILS